MNIEAISDFLADSESLGHSDFWLLVLKKATSAPPLYMEISIAISISQCRSKNKSLLVTEKEANTLFHFSRKSENFKVPTVSTDSGEHFETMSQHTFFRNFIWKFLLSDIGDLAIFPFGTSNPI